MLKLLSINKKLARAIHYIAIAISEIYIYIYIYIYKYVKYC